MIPLQGFIVVVVLLAVAGAAFWILGARVKQLAKRLNEQPALQLLQSQVQAATQQQAQQIDRLREAVERVNNQVAQTFSDSQKTIGERLDSAARVIQNVNLRLGELDQSSKRIFEIGKDIASLQEILRTPKLRGNLGELFLQDLLEQILPPEHFESQHRFQNGELVDAVIRLRAGMVPVDAKFPLENFQRVLEHEDEAERGKARKQFLRDVKKHIDDIASKYIRTDEGTFDFALMYIPAENVYYDIIIKQDEQPGGLSLFSYALNKRVIPVSPNSFYAYLQTILLGLKGLRVEESARLIIDRLGRLRKEFQKFQETFQGVGRNLQLATNKYTEAEKRLGKIGGRMGEIEGAPEEWTVAPAPEIKEPDGSNESV